MAVKSEDAASCAALLSGLADSERAKILNGLITSDALDPRAILGFKRECRTTCVIIYSLYTLAPLTESMEKIDKSIRKLGGMTADKDASQLKFIWGE